VPGGLLAEQQRLESTIARIRWAAVALAVLLGPTFTSLSQAGVVLLGVAVAAYNVAVISATARTRTLEEQRRVATAAYSADLAALCVAMFLFSNDPYWTTFFIGTLVIIGSAFRFGSSGAYVSAVVLCIAYVGIQLFRARAFDLPLEPHRAAFHLSVLALTALLIERVLRDDRKVRAEREDLIRRLERRVAEDAAIAAAMRVVARGPGTAHIPAVLEASRDVFQFDRATVFVADDVRGEYVVVHRLAPGASPPSPVMRIGEGLVGAAIAAGQPLLVQNVLTDPRYVARREGEERRSVIVVPLTIAGEVAGALSLSRALPNAFEPDDVRLAKTVGGLIAQVLENERLFAEASEAKALREMDRLKDEFLAVVSHELRTPLTVISGSLELLARREQRPEGDDRRLIEQAERHVQRLQRSVEDLLDLAQLQEARIELHREFVSVDSVLSELAASHEALLARKGQQLRAAPAGHLPPVLVDRRRIQQALGNLVQNASRYSGEGRTIEVCAEREGDEVRFVVDDEGPGIPAEERERVFDKFYRGERTKETTSGTGLGLAIARQLVQMHGGRIWADERPGGGARLVVALPHEAVPEGAHV
jgi:signal transduction histidine kinase